MQQNVGGALPGVGTMANYGGMRYTNVVFAEDEAHLPPGWPPHGTDPAWIEIDANKVTRDSLMLDPWPITATPDNFVLIVAGGGHPTNSYWLQGYSPGVIGREIAVPDAFEHLLADAARDLGSR